MTEQVKNRELALAVRQALLMLVDALERLLNMEPRTAELRKAKRGQP